jgi:succinoglycan biosynthesis protein ExoW
MPSGVELVLHRQVNGGAGAARNAAIALLDAACGVVAFLDSDDVWSPDHLARALHALAAGAEFYFCDAARDKTGGEAGDNDDASLNAEAPAWFRSALVPIEGEPDLYLYSGPTDMAIVSGLVPTTSTIVHRRQHYQTAHFPSRYFRFGEDQYYCLQFLGTQSRVAYSAAVEVRCGRGVNIFAGNATGSEGQRLCFIDEIEFRKDALASISLSPDATRHVKRKLAEAKRNVLKQGLWLATTDKGRWLKRTLAAQPTLIYSLPSALAAVLADRLRAPARQGS